MNTVDVFPWNENFETGILLIDEQHKRLVHLLNQLAGHLAYQSDIPTLNNIFNELVEYTHYHFETEEGIWERFFCDDDWEIEHKSTHFNFVSEVSRLKGEAESLKPFDSVIEDLLSFLTHWLAFHILETDKRMAKAVLAMQSGLPLPEAKQQAEQQMSGGMKVLIKAILNMYDSLSGRTIQLMCEIKERQKVEGKLRLAANVFDNTLDAICFTDTDFKVIDANPSFCQEAGYPNADVLGKNLRQLKPGLTDENLAEGFWETLKQRGHWGGIINNRYKTGEMTADWLTLSAVKNHNGLVSNYVAIFSNVSNLVQRQQTLERIAHHDALTGLPNRLLLRDRLELAVANAERTHTLLAVCYIDLDGFKPVNDQLGHAAGDELLRIVAQRFLAIVRSIDTVARLGGDEFVILFGGLNHGYEYLALLDRILADISQPVQIKDKVVKISASIGVTIFPDDNNEPELLLQHADQAMYQAKQKGKSRYCLYGGEPFSK